MTEEEAKQWLGDRFGSSALERLAIVVEAVIEETQRQNLIAPSTCDTIWTRHVVDSAQLVHSAPATGTWMDIGTGGGFPGLIVALLRSEPTILVEPRRRRAAFLQSCIDQLDIGTTTRVMTCNVEQLSIGVDVISARAVGSVEKLLQAAAGCATLRTRWILPRGRSAHRDAIDLATSWRGVFHVEQSLTDPDAGILLLDRVART